MEVGGERKEVDRGKKEKKSKRKKCKIIFSIKNIN